MRERSSSWDRTFSFPSFFIALQQYRSLQPATNHGKAILPCSGSMAGRFHERKDGRSVVEALDRRYAVEILHLSKQLVELAQIPDLDIDDDLREIRGDTAHVEIADI